MGLVFDYFVVENFRILRSDEKSFIIRNTATSLKRLGCQWKRMLVSVADWMFGSDHKMAAWILTDAIEIQCTVYWLSCELVMNDWPLSSRKCPVDIHTQRERMKHNRSMNAEKFPNFHNWRVLNGIICNVILRGHTLLCAYKHIGRKFSLCSPSARGFKLILLLSTLVLLYWCIQYIHHLSYARMCVCVMSAYLNEIISKTLCTVHMENESRGPAWKECYHRFSWFHLFDKSSFGCLLLLLLLVVENDGYCCYFLYVCVPYSGWWWFYASTYTQALALTKYP